MPDDPKQKTVPAREAAPLNWSRAPNSVFEAAAAAPAAEAAEPDALQRGGELGRPPESLDSTTIPTVTPPQERPLVCGLLSSGELLIEASGKTVRLSRAEASVLVKYLDLVSDAMAA